MDKRTSYAPLILAILLLLPLLYVGSYVALVVPERYVKVHTEPANGLYCGTCTVEWYRLAGAGPKRLYWPLEQIDRRVRPNRWNKQSGTIGYLPYLRNPLEDDGSLPIISSTPRWGRDSHFDLNPGCAAKAATRGYKLGSLRDQTRVKGKAAAE